MTPDEKLNLIASEIEKCRVLAMTATHNAMSAEGVQQQVREILVILTTLQALLEDSDEEKFQNWLKSSDFLNRYGSIHSVAIAAAREAWKAKK